MFDRLDSGFTEKAELVRPTTDGLIACGVAGVLKDKGAVFDMFYPDKSFCLA